MVLDRWLGVGYIKICIDFILKIIKGFKLGGDMKRGVVLERLFWLY